MQRYPYALTLLAAALVACGGDSAAARASSAGAPAAAETSSAERAPAGVADAFGNGDATLSDSVIERDRLREDWRRFTPEDSARQAAGADSASSGSAAAVSSPDSESVGDIGPASMKRPDVHVPLSGDVAGPSVAKVQILLDRALFSPGIIDGRWGKNTSKAVYWLQHREGLEATGKVDAETLRRLRSLAGRNGESVTSHSLTADEVSGPFVDIPDDVYAKAKLDCLCYQSLGEKLAERFHTSQDMLERLNPDVSLGSLSAGDRILVPEVRDSTAHAQGDVARIVISDGGHYVHAEDAGGRILYHFPSTLGASYAPSPSGKFSVESISWDPKWHYQPDLLSHEPDTLKDAMLPPGPNNAVGIVWMQLSKPHYGIHGTSAPETIGYVTSHGCVRLTNWDARLLAHRVHPGIPVRFVDGDRRVADGG